MVAATPPRVKVAATAGIATAGASSGATVNKALRSLDDWMASLTWTTIVRPVSAPAMVGSAAEEEKTTESSAAW